MFDVHVIIYLGFRSRNIKERWGFDGRTNAFCCFPEGHLVHFQCRRTCSDDMEYISLISVFVRCDFRVYAQEGFVISASFEIRAWQHSPATFKEHAAYVPRHAWWMVLESIDHGGFGLDCVTQQVTKVIFH